MRFPRVRFTLRSMMVIVALTGILLATVIDQARRGRRLIDFEYTRYIANEPLVNPTKVRAIDGGRPILEEGYIQVIGNTRISLEDGRVVLIEDGPFRIGDEATLEDPIRRECVVEIQTQADGSATVYAKRPTWFCGNCLRPRASLIRIPIFSRNVYLNTRVLAGIGRIIEGPASLLMGDRRKPAR